MLLGSIDPYYTIAGFLVGALIGATGLGGGSLLTPVLIVLFGVSPATAVGTDLLFAAATKTVGSIVHGFNHDRMAHYWAACHWQHTGNGARPCRAVMVGPAQ